jgi:hypothetical protein
MTDNTKLSAALIAKLVKEELNKLLSEEDMSTDTGADPIASKKAIDAQIAAHKEEIKVIQSKISTLMEKKRTL